jgi:aspartokinase/homoserine dehydrogenase 1
LIAIDNTACNVCENYIPLAENSFDLISLIKWQYLSYGFIKVEKYWLKIKNYLYETNVGAGLPLIDTIKLLHLSGENITKIKGFSQEH